MSKFGTPSRLLHALHAVLLRSGRIISPFRQPGPADLKCFQMCVGCDPVAPPPAPSPQAWGPGPSIRSDSIPFGWAYAQPPAQMTYKHLTPFSSTSGPYYRGDSRSEHGGKSLKKCVCVWTICMIRWRCLEYACECMCLYTYFCYFLWPFPSIIHESQVIPAGQFFLCSIITNIPPSMWALWLLAEELKTCGHGKFINARFCIGVCRELANVTCLL